MKNIIFLLAGIISIMLVGCGEEASTEGTVSAASAVSSPAQSSSVSEPLAVDNLPNIPSLPEGS